MHFAPDPSHSHQGIKRPLSGLLTALLLSNHDDVMMFKANFRCTYRVVSSETQAMLLNMFIKGQGPLEGLSLCDIFHIKVEEDS